MIRKFATTLLMCASFVTLPAVIGCDRDVSHETKVTSNPNGGTTVEDKKVTEKPDGSIETKKEVKKTNP